MAPATHRRAEDLAEGDGEHGGGGVRAVVDVLAEREGVPAVPAPPYESHRVDLQQQGDGAALVGGLRVEHVCQARGDGELLRPRRVLVQ